MNKRKNILIISLFVVTLSMTFSACEKIVDEVNATGFGIDAERVLIADKNGNIQVGLEIEPGDTDPIDISFESDDVKVATATIGAIDEDGKAITASRLRLEKEELEKEDKEAADNIVIPTDTAIITATGYGECEITGVLGEFSDSVNVIVADKQVALTFDDGAVTHTMTLLEGLEEENVKATFFIVGQMTKRADNHIRALRQAIADGHEIGNHTYNHNAAAASLSKELKKTDKVIQSLGGQKTALMRPPGGAINSKTKKCGKAIILWSLDTLDWKYRNPKTVMNNILKAKDGDIVLLHDLHETSVEGTLKAIPKLKEKGFLLVTVTEIVGDPKPNKIYKKGKKGQLKTQILE